MLPELLSITFGVVLVELVTEGHGLKSRNYWVICAFLRLSWCPSHSSGLAIHNRPYVLQLKCSSFIAFFQTP